MDTTTIDDYRDINSKTHIVKKIQILLGRILSRNEVAYISNYIDNRPDNFMYRRTLEEAQDITVKTLISAFIDEDRRKKHYNEESSSDEEELGNEIVRDIQNREMREQDHDDVVAESTVALASILNISDPYDAVSAFNPGALEVEYNTLWVNTRNRVLADDGDANARKTIKFEFTDTPNYHQGTVNGVNEIQDIVSMEIGTIYLPDIFTNQNIAYRQVSMLLREFREQAGIFNERTSGHILFNTEAVTDTTKLKLTPIFEDCAKLRFDNPLRTLTSLTFSFASPFEPITFTRDRDNITAISSANPAVVTVANTHGLSDLGIVYISGVVSDNAADASIVDAINNINGVAVTAVAGSNITIDVDTSGVAGTLSFTGAEIVYAERCFVIPIKFTYIKSKNKKYNYSTSFAH